MLIFGLVPFAAWIYGPKWLHPYLVVLGLVVLFLVSWTLWRYIEDDRREMAAWPSRSEYRWPAGWDVARYHRVLLTYLKISDWRILSARAVGPDRLLLYVQRDRHHLPLLLVRPGVEPTVEDADTLRAIQREQGLWDAAMITSAPAREEIAEDGRLLWLDYETLPRLEEHLEGPADARHTAPAPPPGPVSEPG